MNIKQKIKYLALMFFIFISFVHAKLDHEVILKNGNLEVGYVAKITHDSVKIVLKSTSNAYSILLDSVLYIHNSQGKLFYIDPKVNIFK